MIIIYTIGHSNHEPDAFLRLLRLAKIEVLVDVRSNPNSAFATFANQYSLKNLLESVGIRYLYMGDILGGRPSNSESPESLSKEYYRTTQEKESFKEGIARLINGAKKYHVCLMCAEESPAYCHRSLLVGSALSREGVRILHIRGDERIQTDDELSKERAGVPVNQQLLPL